MGMDITSCSAAELYRLIGMMTPACQQDLSYSLATGSSVPAEVLCSCVSQLTAQAVASSACDAARSLYTQCSQPPPAPPRPPLHPD
eukprot:3059739-Prymnesium_polylepis.1